MAQNRTEDDNYIQRDFDHIVTKVLDRHPDYLWIESEMAKKITPNRFKQLTGGISIQEIETWMTNYESARNGRKYAPFYLDAEVSDRIWNNEFFVDIADMANQMKMPYGDFGSLSSYGEINGELRLIDYGLNWDVYSTHYNKKPAYTMYEQVADRVMQRIVG